MCAVYSLIYPSTKRSITNFDCWRRIISFSFQFYCLSSRFAEEIVRSFFFFGRTTCSLSLSLPIIMPLNLYNRIAFTFVVVHTSSLPFELFFSPVVCASINRCYGTTFMLCDAMLKPNKPIQFELIWWYIEMMDPRFLFW